MTHNQLKTAINLWQKRVNKSFESYELLPTIYRLENVSQINRTQCEHFIQLVNGLYEFGLIDYTMFDYWLERANTQFKTIELSLKLY